MLITTTFIHVFVAILIVILVLLQDSKGGAMGILGGGGGQSLFGSVGASNLLVKITRWLGIIFATTAISLAYMTSSKQDSVIDTYVPEAAQSGAAGAGATDQKQPKKKADK